MTTLDVRAIELAHVGRALPRAVGRGHRTREGIIVELGDARGRVGRGECAPLPGFSRESLADARRELVALDRRSLALVLDAPLAAQLAALPIATASARFAVETALLDLAGQALDLPLSSLLVEMARDTVPHTSPAVKPRVSLPLAAQLHSTDLRADAVAARARGIQTVKLKIDPHSELARVRDAIGDDFALRLDANQSLAPDALPALAALRCELVEEPLLGGLRGRSVQELAGLPIAADESLLEPGAWTALAHLPLVAIVVKPMALGGFTAALALAARAASAGIATVVTHLWDGPLALAAACALALALPGRVLACGLDRHDGLAAWPPRTIRALDGATIRAVEAPGLGVA